ncbi:MAG: FAD:protein FMN transferase [Gemmatimonadales bacterium]|nr:MAG: FAD:protein FMN transferase [Gemmatimonadales bacterium]
MGTVVRLVIYTRDRGEADSASTRAFRIVSRLDSLFSDYRTDSQVAALSRAAGTGTGVVVSREMQEVLAQSLEWSRRTGGAFDVTVGPLSRLWRWAMRRGQLPPAQRLDSARALAGHAGLAVDTIAGTALLERSGMSLDLGGIAKGYIAQVVRDQLRDEGIPHALVDAGGDLVLGDPPPGEAGWSVEFPGGEVHLLANAAVATSGDRYQYLEVAGVRYSHILDPRTGLGVPNAPTVVVVAGEGAMADVLASALSVLDLDTGRSLVATLQGVAVRWTGRDETGSSWQTAGFPRRPQGTTSGSAPAR